MSDGCAADKFLKFPLQPTSARHREATLTSARLFFAYFLLAKQKTSESPAGARPGRVVIKPTFNLSNIIYRHKMNTDPHWTTYLAALLTPVVAVLGSYVAYRQWRLAQNKLKLDLFERRFAIYAAAQTFLASIMTSGKVNDQELFKFTVATRESKWLLDSNVAEYLDKQLRHKAIDLQCLVAELDGVGVGEIRTTNVRTQADIKKWLMGQYDVLDQKFSSYLQLSH